MSNNLLKINGEYVKFYVTTNSELPELLKNSGSIVIYHEDTAYNSRNYIYLANEMIASGYGFVNASYLADASYVISTYNDIYDSLIEDINDTNKYITNTKNQIYAEPFVRFGDDLGTTYNGKQSYILTIDNEKLPISYLFYNKQPEYKDLEIIDIKNYISYTTLKGTIYNKVLCDSEISIPLYSNITNSNIVLSVKNNDTTGIIAVTAYSDIFENINYTINNTVTNSTGTVELASKANPSPIIFEDDTNKSIFSYFTIYNEGTPATSYKSYPTLKNIFNTIVFSYDNVITPYYKTINNEVKVNPLNTLYLVDSNHIKSGVLGVDLINTATEIFFGNSEDEIVKININNNTVGFIIPANYEIYEVYQYVNGNKINISGNINSFYETHPSIQLSNIENKHVKLSLYSSNFKLNNITEETIYLKLHKTNENVVVNESTGYKFSSKNTPIQNLEWNSLYWTDLTELNYKL